jgi:hypothetical protein
VTARRHGAGHGSLALAAASWLALAAGCSDTPRTLSFLPRAADIQQLEIQDIVRGPDAAVTLFPIEARYALTEDRDHFAGRAVFSVGSKQPRRAEAEVRVPREAVERFLQTVSAARIREGYAPQPPRPGGAFPDVQITLKSRGAADIVLFTRSAGAQYLPWGVEFEGRTYTIESTAPPQGYGELRPFLKREELDRLAQSAVGRVE